MKVTGAAGRSSNGGIGLRLEGLPAAVEIKEDAVDKDMLQRMQEVQKLPDSEKDKITSIIDAFIRDTRAKKAYGMA